MTETVLFNILLAGWAATAVIIGLVLFFVTAPYGRHVRQGWGPTLPSRRGWVIMEALAPVLFLVFFLVGDRRQNLPAIAFLVLWEMHYLHRAFVFPFRLRGRERPMPISIMVSALFFNAVNAYLQGRHLFALGPLRLSSWLADPRFLVGAVLFFCGMAINLNSDGILRRLRGPGETGYRIPRGGLYRWVSCPNYLGELIEWAGWALATWSLPGLVFLLWTAANLGPRARSHHRWYLRTFPDYPPQRRALLPFLF